MLSNYAVISMPDELHQLARDLVALAAAFNAEADRIVTTPGEDYTCSACGETYQRVWSDDEAMAEAAENFPGVDRDRFVPVCDDCYRAIMKAIP